ncbi:MRPL48 isoform 10 [Pan troglodytes]|uniref:MRPL48 isoform 10 n=1 Tax=Pan troglodytes TaxID=9598 RepID=A0A2J8PZF5_PANTR|nr:MRPL48 isoform 9 [Pan troglodytes]PNI89396.1 MRPL48 isoform 10 [Pan troglodytes]
MSGTLEKMLCLRNNTIFKQAFSLLRWNSTKYQSALQDKAHPRHWKVQALN